VIHFTISIAEGESK